MTTNENSAAHEIVFKLYRRAIETPRNDGEARTDHDLVQDGGEAYDGWLQEAVGAGDQQTVDDLNLVGRDAFAADWEELTGR